MCYNGGWDTVARLWQPQNNPYSVLLQANDEIQKQRTLQQTADNLQVLANRGYTGASGTGSQDSCQIMGQNGQCLFYKNIKTPGDYIATNLGATVGQQFSWLTSAQTVNSVLYDATEVMLNRMLNLGSTDEGSYRAIGGSGSNTPTPTPRGTGVTPTPTPGTTSAGCVTQDTQTTLRALDPAIRVAVDALNLDSSAASIRGLLDPPILRVDSLQNTLTAPEAIARTAIVSLKSGLIGFENLALSNDGTAAQTVQLNDQRNSIKSNLDTLSRAPLCR